MVGVVGCPSGSMALPLTSSVLGEAEGCLSRFMVSGTQWCPEAKNRWSVASVSKPRKQQSNLSRHGNASNAAIHPVGARRDVQGVRALPQTSEGDNAPPTIQTWTAPGGHPPDPPSSLPPTHHIPHHCTLQPLTFIHVFSMLWEFGRHTIQNIAL